MSKTRLPTYRASNHELRLVSNHYSIHTHTSHEDYWIVIYYINDNQGQLLRRRLDSDDPCQASTLMIESSSSSTDAPSDQKETILLPSSHENEQSIVITLSSFPFKPVEIIETSSSIPRIMMQTNDKDYYENRQHYNAIHSLLDLNPHYEYHYFNGADRRAFIKQHFQSEPTILEAYDKIISKTFKSDFFRYLFLFEKGGCYFDHKFVLLRPLDTFLSSSMKNALCWDIGHCKLQNGIMMSQPREPFLWNLIQKIISNVHHQFYGSDVLEPTGPILLYQIAHQENILLRFERESASKNYKEETIVVDSNKQLIGYRYYYQYYQTRHYESYGHLWGCRLIYSSYRKVLSSLFTIVIYPYTYEHRENVPVTRQYRTKKARQFHENLTRHIGWFSYPEQFDFELQSDPPQLVITRIHNHSSRRGWEQPLRIQWIREEDNHSVDLSIGSSDSDIKKINIPI